MNDAPQMVEYEGKQRHVAGRLRYPEPPEPGTLIGPNAWGERCVVLATAGGESLIGLATVEDVDRARAAVAEGGPRSELERSSTL